jgi:hypothetical protein
VGAGQREIRDDVIRGGEIQVRFRAGKTFPDVVGDRAWLTRGYMQGGADCFRRIASLPEMAESLHRVAAAHPRVHLAHHSKADDRGERQDAHWGLVRLAPLRDRRYSAQFGATQH